MTVRNQNSSLFLLALLAAIITQIPAAQHTEARQDIAPTYTIFATREGLVGRVTANGHVIQPRDRFVALPSWSVLSSYQGHEYQVRITYRGRSVVAPVWDVGPWNTNDAYWQPDRGAFPDLPVGVPQAQAAYYDDYNGGLDMYGRHVTNPNGIDIADGTFWDDLGMTRNDWVEVSFLWLGADPGPGVAVEAAPRHGVLNPSPVPTITPTPRPEPLDNPFIPDVAVVVDNYSTLFQATAIDWKDHRCGVNGSHTWEYTTADLRGSEARATWKPDLLPGKYEVRAYIPPCGPVPATADARYVVVHDEGTEIVTLDQQDNQGTWATLGAYVFEQRSGMVELSALTDDANQALRVDAIMWLPTWQVPALRLDEPPAQEPAEQRRDEAYVRPL